MKTCPHQSRSASHTTLWSEHARPLILELSYNHLNIVISLVVVSPIVIIDLHCVVYVAHLACVLLLAVKHLACYCVSVQGCPCYCWD